MHAIPYTVKATIEAYEPGSAFKVRVMGLLAGEECERFVATARGTRVDYTGVFRKERRT